VTRLLGTKDLMQRRRFIGGELMPNNKQDDREVFAVTAQKHTNCTCPVCCPDLWAAGIKGSRQPAPELPHYPYTPEQQVEIAEFQLTEMSETIATLKQRMAKIQEAIK